MIFLSIYNYYWNWSWYFYKKDINAVNRRGYQNQSIIWWKCWSSLASSPEEDIGFWDPQGKIAACPHAFQSSRSNFWSCRVLPPKTPGWGCHRYSCGLWSQRTPPRARSATQLLSASPDRFPCLPTASCTVAVCSICVSSRCSCPEWEFWWPGRGQGRRKHPSLWRENSREYCRGCCLEFCSLACGSWCSRLSWP